MLSRGKRLTRTRDFTEVYKRGRRASSPHLRLSYLPANQNLTRFGFVVSNKSARTLAERNRTKRRLRAEIGKLAPHLISGFNVVISAQGKLGGLSSKDISQELVDNLKKAHLWKNS